MTPVDEDTPPLKDNTLAGQRQALRQKLRSQRQLIAHRIDPEPGHSSDFPRSVTMRFLLRRRVLVARVLLELLTVLMGARLLKSVAAALLLSRALLSAPGAIVPGHSTDDREGRRRSIRLYSPTE